MRNGVGDEPVTNFFDCFLSGFASGLECFLEGLVVVIPRGVGWWRSKDVTERIGNQSFEEVTCFAAEGCV